MLCACEKKSKGWKDALFFLQITKKAQKRDDDVKRPSVLLCRCKKVRFLSPI